MKRVSLAIVGAVPPILHPSGWPGLSLSLLEHSPFHSFLTPAIILLLANGVSSLVVLWLTLRRRPGYGWIVAFPGCVVSGWIISKTIMFREVAWLHYLYLSVGLVLIVSGVELTRSTSARAHAAAH